MGGHLLSSNQFHVSRPIIIRGNLSELKNVLLIGNHPLAKGTYLGDSVSCVEAIKSLR